MITPVAVKYNIAQILSRNHQDIIVHDASSGAVCEFVESKWPHKGIMRLVDNIVSELGTGFMDNAYTFVWMRVD